MQSFDRAYLSKNKDRFLKLLAAMPDNRNVRIAKAVVEGATYKAVGLEYGISRERAREIAVQTICKAEIEAQPALNADGNEIDPDSDLFPLSRLRLTVRSANGLSNAGLRTLGDLRELLKRPDHREVLAKVPNLGKKSISEIYELVGMEFPQAYHPEKKKAAMRRAALRFANDCGPLPAANSGDGSAQDELANRLHDFCEAEGLRIVLKQELGKP